MSDIAYAPLLTLLQSGYGWDVEADETRSA